MSHYTLAPSRKLFTKAVYASAVAVTAFAFVAANVATHNGASAKTVVDTSACNYTGVIDQFNASMPAGTVRANTNPEFLMSGASLCGGEMNVRFVLTTTPYIYNTVTRTYDQNAVNGYPFTEVTRDNVVKPGAMSIRYKGGEYRMNQVTQMRTQITAYQSSSFDASGNLLPNAVPLATDVAGWTKTNFVTL